MGKEKTETKQRNGDPNIFAGEMKKLLNNKEFSDIKFIVGKERKTFYAHRCILMTRCMVFKAMFAEQITKQGRSDTETPLVLPDISADMFSALLEFIYTNSVPINTKSGTDSNCATAFDLLGSAIEYGLEDLQKVCLKHLQSDLSPHTACDAMRTAITYEMEQLTAIALKYIEENTEEVVEQKNWVEMTEAALREVLLSDNLNIDEMALVKAIRNWTTVNALAAGKTVVITGSGVVPHLRLALLSKEELEEIEQLTKNDRMIPAEQMVTAWKIHAFKDDAAHAKNMPLPRKGTKSRPHLKGLQGRANSGS